MIIVEAEHEFANVREVTDFIGYCRDNGLDVIVSPPCSDRHLIARYMDASATGIMLPHAETIEQVNVLASWVKYPPEGNRAIVDGPNTDFRMPDVARYCCEVNEATLIFLKVESRLGLENAEGMFETGWGDGLVFRPVDLSLDWGLPGQVDHPALIAAMDKTAHAAMSLGIAVVRYAKDVENYRKERDRGAQIFQYGPEINVLSTGAEAFVNVVRSGE